MKKLTTLMAAGLGLLAYNSASAQVGLHVNFNLGGVAVHAAYNTVPVDYPVYNNADDYYYLPDVEAYYSVPQHCYYYNDGGRWISAAYLPGAYRNYDWREARHYEIRADRPFMHHDMYRTRYGGYNNGGRGFGNDRFGDMRGGYPDNRFDDHNRYGQMGGGFDNHNNGMDDHRQYGDNRGQFPGGFDRGDRMNRGGQYQNGGQNRNGFDQGQRGGQYQGGNQGQPQMGGNPYQNRNDQNRGGGQYQNGNGNNPQSQNGNGPQYGGQNRGGQPANNGQGNRNGGYQNDNHFAANNMGVMRPPRF